MDIQIVQNNLPSKLEDLAQFVLVGREKLTAVRAGIRAIDKLELASDVRNQKKEEAQMLAEALLDAEAKIGEITMRMPKASKWDSNENYQRDSGVPLIKTKLESIEDLGFSKKQVQRFETLAQNKDILEQVKAEAREADDLPTRTEVLRRVKQVNLEDKKQQNIEKLKADILKKPIIYHCDYGEFLDNIENNSQDLLITDPPYSTDVDDIKSFVIEWLPKALSKLKSTGRAFVCIGAYPEEIKTYLDVLEEIKEKEGFIIDSPLIWTYRNTLGITPKRKYNLNYQMILHIYRQDSFDLDTSITAEMFSVQDINAPDGRQGDRFYKWQKPNELARRLISHSTQTGDKVFDPFAGSGTFVLMAAKLNRNAIGCEIDKNVVELCKTRGCDVKGLF